MKLDATSYNALLPKTADIETDAMRWRSFILQTQLFIIFFKK